MSDQEPDRPMTDMFASERYISLGGLLRLLKQYDRENHKETHVFPGFVLADFINCAVGGEPGEFDEGEVGEWLAPLEYTEDPKDYGDILTIEDFKHGCEVGPCFTDWDGHGRPMKDGKVAPNITIQPSRLYEIPLDATHIQWFNK